MDAEIDPEFVATCFHESAHACAAVALGRKVNYVEIEGCGKGCCVELRRNGPITLRVVEAQVVIQLSGGLGEAIHRGARHDVLAFAQAYCGMDTDLRRARSLIADYDLNERMMVRQTMSLLQDHWKAVALVASGLMHNRRVEHDQFLRWIWYAS